MELVLSGICCFTFGVALTQFFYGRLLDRANARAESYREMLLNHQCVEK
jgi:hypothetical protein